MNRFRKASDGGGPALVSTPLLLKRAGARFFGGVGECERVDASELEGRELGVVQLARWRSKRLSFAAEAEAALEVAGAAVVFFGVGRSDRGAAGFVVAMGCEGAGVGSDGGWETEGEEEEEEEVVAAGAVRRLGSGRCGGGCGAGLLAVAASADETALALATTLVGGSPSGRETGLLSLVLQLLLLCALPLKRRSRPVFAAPAQPSCVPALLLLLPAPACPAASGSCRAGTVAGRRSRGCWRRTATRLDELLATDDGDDDVRRCRDEAGAGGGGERGATEPAAGRGSGVGGGGCGVAESDDARDRDAVVAGGLPVLADGPAAAGAACLRPRRPRPWGLRALDAAAAGAAAAECGALAGGGGAAVPLGVLSLVPRPPPTALPPLATLPRPSSSRIRLLLLSLLRLLLPLPILVSLLAIEPHTAPVGRGPKSVSCLRSRLPVFARLPPAGFEETQPHRPKPRGTLSPPRKKKLNTPPSTVGMFCETADIFSLFFSPRRPSSCLLPSARTASWQRQIRRSTAAPPYEDARGKRTGVRFCPCPCLCRRPCVCVCVRVENRFLVNGLRRGGDDDPPDRLSDGGGEWEKKKPV